MKEHVFHSAHVELRVQPPVPVLSFLHVLVRVTIAVMEHYDQRNLGRKGFMQLNLLHHSPSTVEVKAGTQAEQGTWRKDLMQAS